MPIKVGFLVGKDTDLVEDEKYFNVGDAEFLSDLPDIYRVDSKSHEYLKNCEEGTSGQAHADVAVAWYIHKNYSDIQVDIIFPEDISVQRLKSNVINFVVGYDVINAVFESRADEMADMFKSANNVVPSMDVQEFIYMKSIYMTKLQELGVPMAPTVFSFKDKRSPEGLLSDIEARGWKTFVMKQSYMAFSLGFRKLTVEACRNDPKILEEYFEEFEECPEYVVQEAVEGFTRNWETRCFWFNGEFLYAIANKAAVSTEDGAEHIVTGDDIPEEFLENAKKIGKEALKCLPALRTPTGQEVPMTLIRTDIGCSDSQMHDKDLNWDPTQKTFFLNEIEYGGTTYFIRHLKFDAMPLWGKLYAEKAREMYAKMQEAEATVDDEEEEAEVEASEAPAKKARGAGGVIKRPAAQTKTNMTSTMKRPAAQTSSGKANVTSMKRPAAAKRT